MRIRFYLDGQPHDGPLELSEGSPRGDRTFILGDTAVRFQRSVTRHKKRPLGGYGYTSVHLFFATIPEKEN